MNINELKQVIHSNYLINHVYDNPRFIHNVITVYNREESITYAYKDDPEGYLTKLISSLILSNRVDDNEWYDKFDTGNGLGEYDNFEQVALDSTRQQLNIETIVNNINSIEDDKLIQLIEDNFFIEHFKVAEDYKETIIRKHVLNGDNIEDVTTLAVSLDYVIQEKDINILSEDLYEIEDYVQKVTGKEYSFNEIKKSEELRSIVNIYLIENKQDKIIELTDENVVNFIVEEYRE